MNDYHDEIRRLQYQTQIIEQRQNQIELAADRLQQAAWIMENRRFALDQARRFFYRASQCIISAEAVLHTADMFFRYLNDGELPDPNQAGKAILQFTENVVQSAFPSTGETE